MATNPQKPDKQPQDDGKTPFERFQELARKVVAVPREKASKADSKDSSN